LGEKDKRPMSGGQGQGGGGAQTMRFRGAAASGGKKERGGENPAKRREFSSRGRKELGGKRRQCRAGLSKRKGAGVNTHVPTKGNAFNWEEETCQGRKKRVGGLSSAESRGKGTDFRLRGGKGKKRKGTSSARRTKGKRSFVRRKPMGPPERRRVA